MFSKRIAHIFWLAVTLMVAGPAIGQNYTTPEASAHYVLNPSSSLRISDPEYLALKEPISLEAALVAKEWGQYSQRQSFLPGQYKSIWYRFSLETDHYQQSTWWLSLNWSLLDKAQVHVFDTTQEQWHSSRPVGTAFPIKERYRDSLYFDFPLNIDNHGQYIVYLSIETTNILSVPLVVSTEKQLNKHYTTEKFLIGALFGCLVIMFVYNLALAVLLKDRNYYYYCFYIASILLYELGASGVGNYFLWDSIPFLKEKAFTLFGCLGFLSATLFVVKFLDLENYSKSVKYGTRVTISAWAIICLLAIPFTYAAWLAHIINAMSFLMFFFGVVYGMSLSIRGNTSAKIFMLSWFVLMIGTGLFMLAIFGKIQLILFTQYAQMAGFVIEMALLSFALAYRINIDRLQREAAQRNALTLAAQVNSEREKRLQAQKESLDMQTQLNLDLERQVKERTVQLENAMEKLEEANIELTNLSNTDALTAIYNRRYFDTTFDVEYKRGYRTKQSLALILIDIDHFKSVNDTYGHSVGDACIQAVAEALSKEAKRPGDILARYGGEEFVMLLPGVHSHDAEAIAEQCRRTIEQLKPQCQAQQLEITVSCGIAAWIPNNDDNNTALINAADEALYQAKHQGRNCVVVSSLSGKISAG